MNRKRTVSSRVLRLAAEWLVITIVVAGVGFLAGCSNDTTTGPDSDQTDSLVLTDWTETTHGNSGGPDYDEVFSDGVVRRVDIVIDPANWQAMLDDMTANYGAFGSGGMGGIPFAGDEDPIWVPGSFFYNDIQWYQVGVRFKGNSSLRTTWQRGIGKLSFKLDFDEFEDQFSEIQDQRFYGFKQLNLGNGYDDKSLLRERATAEIFREAGVPAVHTAFYRVFVDHGDGPVYFGLYTMIEEVDDTGIDDLFNDNDGNLYKPEGRGASFAYGTFNANDFTKKSNEDESDWSDIEGLFEVLHSSDRTTNPALWRSTLDTVLDVDGYLKWLAVNTVVQNWDTYGIMEHNYLLYHDPDGGLLTWIPWDNNEALQDGKQGGAISLGLSEVTDEWPLIRYLSDDAVCRSTYNDYVRYTIDSVFVPYQMVTKYQVWHDLIEPYVTGSDGEIAGYTFLSSAADFDTELSFLINHVSNREAAAAVYLESLQ